MWEITPDRVDFLRDVFVFSFVVSVLKLDQAGSHSLPRKSKGRSKDDSDEAGIRTCQSCMDCLERYGCIHDH